MSRRGLVLLLVFLLGLTFSSAAYAQTDIPTLQQAIAAGQVNARFYGTGGSSGDTVMVDVSKGASAAFVQLTVSVPTGSQLASSDAGAQSMTVVAVAGLVTGAGSYSPRTDIVVPASGTATYILRAFCTEFHKNNPSGSTYFTLRLPDATLTCLARESVRARLSIEATQAAVWMYTDRLSFQEMNTEFSISAADWNSARNVASACGITPR